MRQFKDKNMWGQRNSPDPRRVEMPVLEIPASSINLTEESGARMSELHPLYLANQGGFVMTTASDYGTLVAAGRPLR